MSAAMTFLAVLFTLWTMAFFGASLIIWTVVLGVLLYLMQSWGVIFWLGFILWPAYIAFAVIFNMSSLRRELLTKHFFVFFKKILPPMSETEKTAIEAGDVWWDGDLFSGKPNWSKLLALPKTKLSAEEQSFMDNQVDTLCNMLEDWKIVEGMDLPPQVWEYIKSEGFFGMIIPKSFGGLGFSAYAHSCVVTRIGSRSGSAAVTVMVPNSLGPGELLMHYGTDEQKNYYLPRLAKGLEIPCFALTGPEAGSDAGSIPDNGVICRGEFEGKEVIGIRLNWDKRYITLAPVATVLGLAFKLFDPDKLLSSVEDLGITVCLIPTNLKGIEIGKRHIPLQMAFMNGPTRGKDVFIPLDMIIGGPKMVGQGWRMLMECLSVGRGISLPALSTASGESCFRMTGAYARLRKQFKLSIGKFEGVEEALSRIGGLGYVLHATRKMTAGAIDLGVKPAVVSAIAKYHMTEIQRTMVNDAMDIHAGRGIIMGPRNYLASAYISIPISITVEGANILTRNLIIFGQGAIRCHPYVRAEMEAASISDPAEALKQFDNTLFKHIGYTISNVARLFAFGLSRGHVGSSPLHGPISPYFGRLTWMSSALSVCADVAMLVLGGNLKRKERLSARLGDVLSYLYLSSAVIKYFHEEDERSDDWVFVEWALQTYLYKSQEALIVFCQNFSNKWVGRLLRFMIFPTGRAFNGPSDELSHLVADKLLHASELRDRITDSVFVGTKSSDPMGRMEMAFALMILAEPLEQRISKAEKEGQMRKTSNFEERITLALEAKVIDTQEAKILKDFELARQDAIKVDEFSKEEVIKGCN